MNSDEPIKRSEHVEQRELISWFRKRYPGVLIYAIPNGGKRGKAEAMRLKCEGVTSGIPDLHIPAWCLWIEMKTETGGKLSADQKVMISHLDSIGHSVIVGYGKKDAIEKILSYCEKNTLHFAPRV